MATKKSISDYKNRFISPMAGTFTPPRAKKSKSGGKKNGHR